jgi:polyisoprenoid-binding protein YceI
MHSFKKLSLAGIIFCLLPFTLSAQAQETLNLDNKSSSLTFVTVKLEHVAETLKFKELSGTVQPNGSAKLVIDVDSIDAIFDIRNERMKEQLFKIMDFPTIEIGTQLDMNALDAITDGKTTTMNIDATMKLLGTAHKVPAEVFVTKVGNGFLVNTAKPIILNAGTLGLEDGVAKLAELAGGIGISRAVSVSFTLRFE